MPQRASWGTIALSTLMLAVLFTILGGAMFYAIDSWQIYYVSRLFFVFGGCFGGFQKGFFMCSLFMYALSRVVGELTSLVSKSHRV